METMCKPRRQKVSEQWTILGVFSLTIMCLLFRFFYLDHKVVSRSFHLKVQAHELLHSTFSGQFPKKTLPGFLDVGAESCNLFQGKWIWDEAYPLYSSEDCKFIDDGFRCTQNGRRDQLYSKWRWQPSLCDLPRFDPNLMLEKLRNRRLVFVGDSIGRNQWESFLCMLSSAVLDKDTIYEVNGKPITKHDGFFIFKFSDVNCTIEYYRAPFLVLQSRPSPGAPEKVKTTLKLDKLDWTSNQWKDADVLIFNTGHWWNHEKTVRGGCHFQVGQQVIMEMTIETAYKRAIETLIDWITREVNAAKTQVILRTYSPVHFRGDWRNGGSCHLEKLPELSSSKLLSWPSWNKYQLLFYEVIKEKKASRDITVLDITEMTAMRKDAHTSLYYRGSNSSLAALHRQDCSHWCLPGVPDAWNELLYALVLFHDLVHHQNSTLPHVHLL